MTDQPILYMLELSHAGTPDPELHRDSASCIMAPIQIRLPCLRRKAR